MSQPCSSLPHRQSSEFPSFINPPNPNRVWANFQTLQVHQSCHWFHSMLEQDLKFVWFLLVNDTRKWVRRSMLSLKKKKFLCPDTTSWLFFRSLLFQVILPFFAWVSLATQSFCMNWFFFFSGCFTLRFSGWILFHISCQWIPCVPFCIISLSPKVTSPPLVCSHWDEFLLCPSVSNWESSF